MITLNNNTNQEERRIPLFNITLNADETYQVQARGSADGLAGSFITANKKVNVFSGSK